MSETRFDVIVLGTGPAGGTIARKAAADGRKTAIVEAREFGGTCALRGCNPKKVYVNAASLIDQVRRADGKLVTDNGVHIDWPQLLKFKQTFTMPVAEKSEASFQDAGIATFHGDARFVDENTLAVGDQKLTAERFAIAVGARPAPLSIPGAEYITHSDDFFELKELPARVLFIGGGYVSMEFAHVVARSGAETTVVEHNDRVLTGFDPDLVQLLQRHSEQRGITFRLGRQVTAVEKSADGALRVQLDDGGTIACDLVVHGAGRAPNLDGLQLDAAGVDVHKTGLVVNEYLQSPTNPRVFAAGDCAASDQPKLTPVANEEARIVAKNLFADEPETRPDYGKVPAVAFTVPAIAAVGMSAEDANSSEANVDVRFGDTSSWSGNRKTGDTVAAFKVLIDKSNDKILGTHLLGPQAEETINLFALAMKFHLTTTDLKSTLFVFPTAAADVRNMV